MLPFHILTRFKESIYKTKDEFKKNNNETFNILIFPSIHKYFRDNVFTPLLIHFLYKDY